MEREHFDKLLSSYQHLGKQAYSLLQTPPSDVHDLLRWIILRMPIVPILITCHVIYASLATYTVTKGRDYWLKSLVLTTIAAFGGSTLAAILSNSPPPLFTVSSNPMIISIISAWYLIYHNPPLRTLLQFRPIHSLIAFGATIAKARSIFSFMDTFMKRYSSSAAAGAIVLGGLAGCGGTLLVSIDHGIRTKFSQPSELSRPGWSVRGAYAAAVAYYVATDPHGFLGKGFGIALRIQIDKDDARFWIALMLAMHAAMEVLLGIRVNPLRILDEIVVAVTRVNTNVEEEEEAEKTNIKEIVEESHVKVGKVANGDKRFQEGLRKRKGAKKQ